MCSGVVRGRDQRGGTVSDYLVIVESPAKAKTISKFLGKKYRVVASMGHVRDLPKSSLGVDIEHSFRPKYITIRGKGQTIKELKDAAKKASRVLLATDPDREGEAISWHLSEILNIDPKSKCRIEFNEITRSAIQAAAKSPRPIDIARVNAQQARRILDRLVGYKLSPFLWSKVKPGLSAGRVQSVAVRLICDREREIQSFVPEEYWTTDVLLAKASGKETFKARVVSRRGEKLAVANEAEARAIAEELVFDSAKRYFNGKRELKGRKKPPATAGPVYKVESVVRKDRLRRPAPPFTTSTLQQEASRKLGFYSKRTMAVAQQLYEGLDIKGEGMVGLVTYIRTDSTRVAAEAQAEARSVIERLYGKSFVPETPPVYSKKAGAQDAHESIRPTSVARHPDAVKDSLTRDQYRLYKLIWERFVASQMSPAVLDTVTAEIFAGEYGLRATGSRVKFPGFMAVYTEGRDDEVGEEDAEIPELMEGEVVSPIKLEAEQHFTQPPPRYTDASLVRALEEKGIGRPSTYAPTIETIVQRGYVVREKRRLLPTEIGFIVVDLLKEHFPEIISVEFTAGMEEELDKVEEGRSDWVQVLDSFYRGFEKSLEEAKVEAEKIEIPDEVTDELCPVCGRNLVIKTSRYGKFLACPGFPECTFKKPLLKDTGAKCPVCGGSIVERRSRKGRTFYGCSNYPSCTFTSWARPAGKDCPECGAAMVVRQRKAGKVFVCSNEKCRHEEPAESS